MNSVLSVTRKSDTLVFLSALVVKYKVDYFKGLRLAISTIIIHY